ncbi:MAG: hypothetical protein P4N24_01535 [Acidobacteriota bacterium]|nr:hypothetical protein [Acidobacteriota bacterium]
MRRTTLLVTTFLLGAALPLAARPQQQESLGDAARQLQAQHQRDSRKATRVFTNDNLPAAKPGEALNVPPTPAAKPSAADKTASMPATPPAETATTKPESPEGKDLTRDDWQAKFRAARQDLAKAKEQAQLTEDELNLLQIQQAREMDPTAKADLATKVQAKQSEADLNRKTMEDAQKALDDLQAKFKESGAPDDWSQTE